MFLCTVEVLFSPVCECVCVCVCVCAHDTTVEGTYGKKVHDEGHKKQKQNSTAGSECTAQLYGT